MTAAGPLLRLSLARACAWALLVAGWIGLGTLALRVAPSAAWGFGAVALWLLALGAAAAVSGAVSARRDVSHRVRALAIVACAAVACGALSVLVRGGDAAALLVALAGWSALTALASGVVRSVRLAQSAPPGPPIGAATLGALGAGLVLGDPGEHSALALRLAAFVAAAACLLVLLQRRLGVAARGGCRAGLFDCSLPAWPAGAWRDALQWPTLLAGLAMLPMMAALPLMADWCRTQAIAAQGVLLLHLAAMFVPALVLRHAIARWSARALSSACAALLLLGAASALWAPAPGHLLGLAAAHGAAWGLAWGGQLWAPARRGRQGASPLAAAAGYAVLTLAFGIVVDRLGARGVVDVHAGLALVAAAAWLAGIGGAHRPRHAPPPARDERAMRGR